MIKRVIEIVLLFFLTEGTLELAWRRVVWGQSPPEVPWWAWAALIAGNVVFGAYALRRWREAARSD